MYNTSILTSITRMLHAALLIFTLLFVSLSISAQDFKNSYYNAKRALHQSIPEVPGAIVMLGNSLTERGCWSEYFPGTDILNRGIGGDIFAGMLDRVEEIMRNRPSKVFIMAGANDILFHQISGQDLQANYRKLLAAIKRQQPNCKIYMSSVLPVNETIKPENTFLSNKNNTIVAMNKLIKGIAASSGATYIDLHPHLLKEAVLNPAFTEDGVHLNEKGYLVWAAQLKTYVYE